MQRGVEHEALILAAHAGQAEAISRLLTLCQKDARQYAYKHCHASDVDDAVQESLLAVARKIKGLKTVAAFSAWLFTTIKRACAKLRRQMLKHDSLSESVLEDQLILRSDAMLRIDLTNALESLPAHYLEVVLLRDFEEYTIAEIAVRLGESTGAVKSRLRRARELVRAAMLCGALD